MTKINLKPSAIGGNSPVREIYGTAYINNGSETFRNIVWTFGGDFFQNDPSGNPDFRRVALDTPAAQAAIELIVRLRLRDRTAFNATGVAKDGGQEFMNGNASAATARSADGWCRLTKRWKTFIGMFARSVPKSKKHPCFITPAGG